MKRMASHSASVLLIYLCFALPGLLPGIFQDAITHNVNPALRRIIFYLPLLAWLLYLSLKGSIEDRRIRGWTMPRNWDWAFVPGLLLITIAVGLVLPTSPPVASSLSGLFPILFLSIELAVAEELFFRSWMLTIFDELGVLQIFGIGISSLLFAVLHNGAGFVPMVFAGFAAILYATVFIKRRCLPVLIIAHVLHNTVAVFLPLAR